MLYGNAVSYGWTACWLQIHSFGNRLFRPTVAKYKINAKKRIKPHIHLSRTPRFERELSLGDFFFVHLIMNFTHDNYWFWADCDNYCCFFFCADLFPANLSQINYNNALWRKKKFAKTSLTNKHRNSNDFFAVLNDILSLPMFLIQSNALEIVCLTYFYWYRILFT